MLYTCGTCIRHITFTGFNYCKSCDFAESRINERETWTLVISSWLRQLMLCFVSLSNNPLKPFESCRRILQLFPLPGIELKHYRLSKIICAMESESHSSLQYTFLPSPLNCPRTPGFMSFKVGHFCFQRQRGGEYGGRDQYTVTCPTSFPAAAAAAT